MQEVGVLSRLGGFVKAEDLGRYFGVPILHKRVIKQTYHYVVDIVLRSISSWSAKTLLFIVRYTLTQSILSNIPNYVMQT